MLVDKLFDLHKRVFGSIEKPQQKRVSHHQLAILVCQFRDAVSVWFGLDGLVRLGDLQRSQTLLFHVQKQAFSTIQSENQLEDVRTSEEF
jgi:hypothetical protein